MHAAGGEYVHYRAYLAQRDHGKHFMLRMALLTYNLQAPWQLLAIRGAACIRLMLHTCIVGAVRPRTGGLDSISPPLPGPRGAQACRRAAHRCRLLRADMLAYALPCRTGLQYANKCTRHRLGA
jgi:hypothetical protein